MNILNDRKFNNQAEAVSELLSKAAAFDAMMAKGAEPVPPAGSVEETVPPADLAEEAPAEPGASELSVTQKLEARVLVLEQKLREANALLGQQNLLAQSLTAEKEARTRSMFTTANDGAQSLRYRKDVLDNLRSHADHPTIEGREEIQLLVDYIMCSTWDLSKEGVLTQPRFSPEHTRFLEKKRVVEDLKKNLGDLFILFMELNGIDDEDKMGMGLRQVLLKDLFTTHSSLAMRKNFFDEIIYKADRERGGKLCIRLLEHIQTRMNRLHRYGRPYLHFTLSSGPLRNKIRPTAMKTKNKAEKKGENKAAARP